MANCIISATAQFDSAQPYRRAERATILALKGKTGVTFTKSGALHPTWSEDQDRVYCGLVPVIDGKQRLDLALLINDIVVDVVYAIDPEGRRLELVPQDRFHKLARRLADQSGATYDSILDGIIEEFDARPGVLAPLEFTALSSKGRQYPKAILAFE